MPGSSGRGSCGFGMQPTAVRRARAGAGRQYVAWPGCWPTGLGVCRPSRCSTGLSANPAQTDWVETEEYRKHPQAAVWATLAYCAKECHRRGRDSNPRYGVTRTLVFETSSFSRSDTSPESDNHATAGRTRACPATPSAYAPSCAPRMFRKIHALLQIGEGPPSVPLAPTYSGVDRFGRPSADSSATRSQRILGSVLKLVFWGR